MMTNMLILAVPIFLGAIVLWLQQRAFAKRDVWIKSLKEGDLVLHGKKVKKIESFSTGLYFNSRRFYEENPDKELRNKLTVLFEGEHRFVSIGEINLLKNNSSPPLPRLHNRE